MRLRLRFLARVMASFGFGVCASRDKVLRCGEDDFVTLENQKSVLTYGNFLGIFGKGSKINNKKTSNFCNLL